MTVQFPSVRFPTAPPPAGSLPPALRRVARQSRLLAAMPEELCGPLLGAARAAHHARGDTIFRQGDTARVLHVVAGGWVKLYRIAQNGAEAVVGIFTNGQSFGEPLALRGDPYPVFAEAVTDCTLIQIPSDALLDLIRVRPEAAISILSATYMHLHALVAQIEQLKAQSGTQRVAEFLLELCPEGTEAATVTLPYDKTLIAGRLGMKPESLSRAFARLRTHGVVVRHASAAIASTAVLRQLVAEDPGAAWTRML